MGKNLVIVESPAKAKTIEKMLGSKYTVQASYGHVRDLPKSKLGVDVDGDYSPQYVIPTKNRKQVTKLKELAKKADMLYLATDEDREGEAIGWHVQQVLGLPPEKVKRVAFHEITKEAIDAAFANPRDLDLNLVNAQQTRRILDRLVGYKLSPLLWKKIFRRLSAGRVQSVALRILAEREKEIEAFKPVEYWRILNTFEKEGTTAFQAEVVSYKGVNTEIGNEASSNEVVAEIRGADAHIVDDIKKEERQRKPSPPFTTSTLQQQASIQLGFSVKKTMMLAQQLYEGVEVGDGRKGIITYMRTDSTNLAISAVSVAREVITKKFGGEFIPEKPILYKTNKRGAQEAHEAIRPSYPDLEPDAIKDHVTSDQFRLYRLIWQRMLASQMKPALVATQDATIKSGEVISKVSGAKVIFAGFAAVVEKWPFKEIELPLLNIGDKLNLVDIDAQQHFTEPPGRFTEASLVKKLEQMGIGRPSTYAPTISTIMTRGYVEKVKKTLVPQDLGMQVNDFLMEHFPSIVDYNFTAKMEDELDDIADGKAQPEPVIKAFYEPFIAQIELKDKELVKQTPEDEETDQKCMKCGSAMVIKTGRFGKFLACSNFPTCKHTEALDKSGKSTVELTDQKCEKCGQPMVKKMGRFGPFLGCSGYPECKNIKNIEPEGPKMPCPKCVEGYVVTKRTKRGKMFWGCSKYPECDYASWTEPLEQKCPTCRGAMVKGKKGVPTCTECGYEEKGAVV